jgi:hypothetical protein
MCLPRRNNPRTSAFGRHWRSISRDRIGDSVIKRGGAKRNDETGRKLSVLSTRARWVGQKCERDNAALGELPSKARSKGSTMISALSGLPEGVIGFEASGKIAAADYRDVVLPAVERAARTGDVRFLIVMRDFDGMSGGAVWQDLKVGVEHLHAWKRIALVTDIGWMSNATNLFGWMTPGETRTFPLDQRDEAIRWLTE